MRPHKLFNLFKANRDRGQFRAEGNTIFLYDVIVGSELEAEWWGGVSPEGFIRQLSAMSGTVHLRINSPGGDVFAARVIAQHIREFKGEVIAHIDGLAASAASLIAVTPGKCVMAPGSFMMIHRAWTLAMGNSEELKATADLLDQIDGTIAETYAAKTGGSVEDFAAAMAKETWYTPAQALELGLCNEIAGANDSAQASIRWDLSAFEAAPAAETEPPPAPEPEPAPPADPVEVPRLQDPEPVADPAAELEHRRRVHAVRMLVPSA